MCGICGYFSFAGSMNKDIVKKMSKILIHRGPDDKGYYFGKKVGLGVRRLSIIDLEKGHQPIHNENKKIWIVFNGEIYNFKELRKDLEKRHKFYTNTDTEVIVHSYEELGEKCVKKFNGMFAFAIWDSTKNQLFIARDRFGIKPLYYFFDKNQFIFASEIKALLATNNIKKMPNDKIIYQYLVFGLHDHTEETFFKGIKRLLPGHYITVTKRKIKIKKYWDIKKTCPNVFTSPRKKDKEYVKKFFNLLKSSVEYRLISEVPVGTCLSGGLDSSSIVALINKILKERKELEKIVGKIQKTFSACYEDKKIDERKYIEEITNHLKIEKNYTFPSWKKMWRELKKLVYYQDEPFGGTSQYAQWCVMKIASKKVKVVLDGQGGDELLGGYIPYFGIFFIHLFKERKFLHLFKEVFKSLDLTTPLFLRYFKRKEELEKIKKMLKQEFVKKWDDKSVDKWKEFDNFHEMLYYEVTKNSLPRLLRYEDRNSMAFSIEARVPFLDYRLVEFVFSLPLDQKIRNGWTKYILRKSFENLLPKKIVKRRNKIGFATPEAKWLKNLAPQIRRVFLSKKFGERKYFNQPEILKEFDKFCKGKLGEEYSRVFWRILNLEIWFRVFFEKEI